MCLVLKQERQRRLRCICSETSRQFKATGFISVASTGTQMGSGSVTFTLASVLQQVLVGYGEVASLESPSLAIGSLGWVQLPGRRVGSLVVPHRTETDSDTFVVKATENLQTTVHQTADCEKKMKGTSGQTLPRMK